MGGSLSGVLSGIFMRKLEADVVEPERPILYVRYVDDIYCRRKKGTNDTLFEKLNSYHPNMKFTIENNPDHFLDTAIHRDNDNILTSVYIKPNKLPTTWTSRVPKKYKKNALRTELFRAKEISSDFETETQRIMTKFRNAGYPNNFIRSTINEFNNPTDEIYIPPWLFEDRETILIRLPYCETNEQEIRKLTKKLTHFTQDRCTFRIIWNTKKIRALFPLKDRNLHRACVIYKGKCSCNELYMGQTERIADIRWTEHNQPSKRSDPAKHLLKNPSHSFTWTIICAAPKNNLRRRILEHLHITKHRPLINEQLESDTLLLFRHGIT